MPALSPRAPDSHLAFMEFVETRPDEEKWELIGGRYVMQAQPNFHHQLIAGDLERLLSEGLRRVGASRVALQNPALDLRPAIEGHTYVPDVAVLDWADIEPGRNVTRTFYLAAEILSPSDRRRLSGSTRQKIDVKLAGYEAVPSCEAVLLIEQQAYDVTVSERRGGAWVRTRLTAPADRIVLPAFGLDRPIADLYARTALARVEAPG
ncbi:Uma2 family endonuclease [Methylobacterium sp. A54F]